MYKGNTKGHLGINNYERPFYKNYNRTIKQ